MGWPASALESSASVPQPEDGLASLSERQQQQYWQAFAQSVGHAPDPGSGASPARAPGQDARWRSSPGHAPQQPLEAVPEGELSYGRNAGVNADDKLGPGLTRLIFPLQLHAHLPFIWQCSPSDTLPCRECVK